MEKQFWSVFVFVNSTIFICKLQCEICLRDGLFEHVASTSQVIFAHDAFAIRHNVAFVQTKPNIQ